MGMMSLMEQTESIGYACPIVVHEGPFMQEEINAEVKDKTAMLYMRAKEEGRTVKDIRVSGSVMEPGILEDGPEVRAYLGTIRSTYNPK